MRSASFIMAGIDMPVLNQNGNFEIRRVNPNTVHPPKEVVETVHDYVPHEGQLDSLGKRVDCTVFAEKREKRTFQHKLDLTAYHGQIEFKVTRNYSTNLCGQHLPIHALYWKCVDYKLNVKTWYYIDDYKQFLEISDHDYVEIYRSYGGDFKKRHYRCDSKFFKIVQCFIFMNGLENKIPNYGVGNSKVLGKVADGYFAGDHVEHEVDKSRLTTNMGGRRAGGKCHSMDPFKAQSSGDPLSIAEAISCKCDVNAAFARAARNGEMEYV